MSAAPPERSLEPLVGPFLARQRWYPTVPGAGERPAARVVEAETLAAGSPGLVWLMVETGGAVLQVLVGLRPEAEAVRILRGRDRAVLGPADGLPGRPLAYDALADPELVLQLLDSVGDGACSGRRVRHLLTDIRHTCLVIDDRLLFKVFRQLDLGPNPEVELTYALDGVGFNHLAPPLATWRRDDADLAMVQHYEPGGSSGWALALTSLRDLDAAGGPPEAAGGDFGAEARRLGNMTARLHLALVDAFGSRGAEPEDLAQGLGRALDGLSVQGDAAAVVRLVRDVPDAGAAIRIHAAYDLNAVVRTEVGWMVADFRGDPGRPLEERRTTGSPLQDVAGLVHSFSRVARAATRERSPRERERAGGLGDAWARRNRWSFIDGYMSVRGVQELLPSEPAAVELLLSAFEIQAAARQLEGDLARRPTRAAPTRGALEALLAASGS